MKTDYFPLYDDTADRIAELSDDETERVRTLKSSLEWYQRQSERHGGWTRAIEQCKEELEDLAHTSDIAKLDEVLGDDDEVAELSDLDRELRDVRDAAEWMDDHGWEQAAEDQWERYRALKEGGES